MNDREPYTRYHTFMRGWRAGACASVRDPALYDHADKMIRDEYEAGFARGTMDRRELHAEVCERTGYKPTILRAQ